MGRSSSPPPPFPPPRLCGRCRRHTIRYMIPLVLAVVLVAIVVWRVAWRAHVERSVRARLPVGTGGVIAGAGPIELSSSPPAGALLLLHGFGDTPQSLESLARTLHGEGFGVHVPLLPGHGRTLRDFRASNEAQWVAEATRALHELRARYESVGIVGLSMGGALAVVLAADSDDIPALVLLSPYLEPPPSVRLLAKTASLVGAVISYILGSDPRAIHDPAARAAALSYGAVTPRSIVELVRLIDRARTRLARVTAPTLYVQSREDYRIPVDAAERTFAALGAPEKRLEWLTGCGHVTTVDYEHDKVEALVVEWVRRHM